MTYPITAGSILVEKGVHAPNALLLQGESEPDGWATVKDDRSTFEKTIQEAGWTFFFMAGQIKATVFGFDRQRALRGALKRLIAEVKSQGCNSIQLTQVTNKSFLGLPYVSVSAHSRHLQKGSLFSPNGAGSNPVLMSPPQLKLGAQVEEVL
jgi:hypothetical protein